MLFGSALFNERLKKFLYDQRLMTSDLKLGNTSPIRMGYVNATKSALHCMQSYQIIAQIRRYKIKIFWHLKSLQINQLALPVSKVADP